MSRPTGPKPAPTELKLLRGNPGRRPLGNKARGDIPEHVPAPPPHLREAGLAAWSLYWTSGRAWLATSDIPIITQLCEAHDEVDRISAMIRDEGLTHLNEKTGRSFAHHLYNDLRGVRKEMRELWSLCYMTPTDRGRANVKTVEADPLEEWAAK